MCGGRREKVEGRGGRGVGGGVRGARARRPRAASVNARPGAHDVVRAAATTHAGVPSGPHEVQLALGAPVHQRREHGVHVGGLVHLCSARGRGCDRLVSAAAWTRRSARRAARHVVASAPLHAPVPGWTGDAMGAAAGSTAAGRWEGDVGWSRRALSRDGRGSDEAAAGAHAALALARGVSGAWPLSPAVGAPCEPRVCVEAGGLRVPVA